jgi:hypothetical protein
MNEITLDLWSNKRHKPLSVSGVTPQVEAIGEAEAEAEEPRDSKAVTLVL